MSSRTDPVDLAARDANADDLAALDRSLAGDVLTADSPAYERAFPSAIDAFAAVRPRAVIRCRTPDDVSAAVRFARVTRSPVALRSGGHCFAGRSSTQGLLVDVGELNAIVVEGDVVTVGAGARLAEIYDALDAHGLTLAAGCGPTVGIAGLTLGGGFGILGRSAGLTCDQLLAADVVLASGAQARCDPTRHPDLLWALRGAGGGQFAVVTRFTFRTTPAPPATAVHVRWELDSAADVISAWQRWAPDGPDALAASLLVQASAARRAVHVFGAMLAPAHQTRRALRELVDRAGGAPPTIRCTTGSYRAVKRHLVEHDPAAADAPVGRAAHEAGASEFFAQDLPRDAVEALLDGFHEPIEDGQLRQLDLVPWGGAYGRVPRDATAFAHRDARFLLKHTATTTAASGAARAAVDSWVRRSRAAVRALGTGGVYPNFPDPSLEDWATAYHGANLQRLVAVKRAYDPDDLFTFPQAITGRTRMTNVIDA